MLVLTRKVDEGVRITFQGQTLRVIVVGVVKPGGELGIKLGFDGPREIRVDRDELPVTKEAAP